MLKCEFPHKRDNWFQVVGMMVGLEATPVSAAAAIFGARLSEIHKAFVH